MSIKITDIYGRVELWNGVKMPYLGLGLFGIDDGKPIIDVVTYALQIGYRHFDTASFYGNEKGVGQAIKNSNIPRNEIFVTSKVWNNEQGYDNTLKAFDASFNRLGLEYIDLYLVHWPVKGKYLETYKALEKIFKEKKVKAIGVSNFLIHHIENLLDHCNVIPMVNQYEFHPYLQQNDLLNFCKKIGIQAISYSPFMQGKIFDDPVLISLANKYNKTVAQIVLRWNLQKEVVPIPKSANKERMKSNTEIFDFQLSEEDMKRIDSLDKNQRIGAHPDYIDF